MHKSAGVFAHAPSVIFGQVASQSLSHLQHSQAKAMLDITSKSTFFNQIQVLRVSARGVRSVAMVVLGSASCLAFRTEPYQGGAVCVIKRP
jgi:hypothetical protein